MQALLAPLWPFFWQYLRNEPLCLSAFFIKYLLFFLVIPFFVLLRWWLLWARLCLCLAPEEENGARHAWRSRESGCVPFASPNRGVG